MQAFDWLLEGSEREFDYLGEKLSRNESVGVVPNMYACPKKGTSMHEK